MKSKSPYKPVRFSIFNSDIFSEKGASKNLSIDTILKGKKEQAASLKKRYPISCQVISSIPESSYKITPKLKEIMPFMKDSNKQIFARNAYDLSDVRSDVLGMELFAKTREFISPKKEKAIGNKENISKNSKIQKRSSSLAVLEKVLQVKPVKKLSNLVLEVPYMVVI